MDHLDVRLEDPRRDRRYVLADTAGFLRLTAAEDVIAADLALTANFTTRAKLQLLRNQSGHQVGDLHAIFLLHGVAVAEGDGVGSSGPFSPRVSKSMVTHHGVPCSS
jgi:hypothetical protein